MSRNDAQNCGIKAGISCSSFLPNTQCWQIPMTLSWFSSYSNIDHIVLILAMTSLVLLMPHFLSNCGVSLYIQLFQVSFFTFFLKNSYNLIKISDVASPLIYTTIIFVAEQKSLTHYVHVPPDMEWMYRLQWLLMHFGLAPGLSHLTFSTFPPEAT